MHCGWHGAIHWVTRTHFDARLAVFDAKLDTMHAEIRLEVKSAQLQNLYWLAGIILVSNGALIALMGRVAHLY